MRNVFALAIFAIAGALFASNLIASWNKPAGNSPVVQELESGQELREFIERSDQTLLVDFYADWCGPCRTQSEILSNAAMQLPQDNVRIIKVNVDNHQELAAKFQIRSIPALFVFKGGKVVERHSGIAKPAQILDWLTEKAEN